MENKMKFVILFLMTYSFIIFAGNKIYNGYLYKIDNKIFISKETDFSKTVNIIELDLYESKDVCFKNLNHFCQAYQVVYSDEFKTSNKLILKNAHIQKGSGNLMSKEFKNQNIPMH